MSRVLVSLLVLVGIARAEWDGWHPTAWTNVAAMDTATVWAASVTIVFTNQYSSNAATVATNRFLDPILADNTWAYNPVTARYEIAVQVWTSALPRIATNVYVTTNALFQTNLLVNSRDIMGLDTFRAIRERCRILGVAWPVHQVYRGGWSQFGTYDLYGGQRKNLLAAKDWLATYGPTFVDTLRAPYGTNWTAGSLHSGNVLYPPLLTDKTTILARATAPTNWCEYTPYRQLDGFGIAFTNNTNVVTGFDDLYYGYKRVRDIMNQLIWTKVEHDIADSYRQSAGPIDDIGFIFTLGADAYTNAICGLTAAWTNKAELVAVTNPCEPSTDAYQWQTETPPALPTVRSDAYRAAPSGDKYMVTADAAWNTYSHTVNTTNFQHAAFCWIFSGLLSTNAESDTYGTTYSTQIALTNAFFSTTNSDLTTGGPTIGWTNEYAVPTFPSAPSVPPSSTDITSSARGYQITNIAWLIRWDVTNGLKYR